MKKQKVDWFITDEARHELRKITEGGEYGAMSAYVRKAVAAKIDSGDLTLRPYQEWEDHAERPNVARSLTKLVHAETYFSPEVADFLARLDYLSAFIESAVRDQLERDGVEMPDPQNGGATSSDYFARKREGTSQEIAELYRQGLTLREISERTGVAQGSIVSKYLPDDVPRRGRGKQPNTDVEGVDSR